MRSVPPRSNYDDRNTAKWRALQGMTPRAPPTIDDEATTTAASAVVVFSASVVVVFLQLGIGGADGAATIAGCDGDGDTAVAAELPPQAAVSVFAETTVRRRALFSTLLFSTSILFNLASLSNICRTAFTRRGACFLFLLDGGDTLSMAAAPPPLHSYSVDQLSTSEGRRKLKGVHPNTYLSDDGL